MATLLNTNIRGEQVANATISGVHIVDYSLAPIKVDVYNSPSDGDVLTYKNSTGQFEWNSIGTMVVNEIPTGSINGANTTFVLNDTPVGNTLEVNLNGILQQPGVGNDYTASGVNLAFTTAPETGDILLCSYLVSAGLGGGVYTDHGNLDGLTDDDHSQYILVNGNRAFTGAVAGVTPTIDAHLATKGYVDDELDNQTHSADDITSGTFADDRIAQTNVTQHEGAINHNALLNTHNLSSDINHNTLLNYTITEHRIINDSSVSGTELWSSSKIASEIAAASGTSDHGLLTGREDDDHTQYLLADGTRQLTGDWNAGSYNIGINTAPSHPLHVVHNPGDATSYSAYLDLGPGGTLTGPASHLGFYVNINSTVNRDGNSYGLVGAQIGAYSTGSADLSSINGLNVSAQHNASSSLNELIGSKLIMQTTSTGSVNNLYGRYGNIAFGTDVTAVQGNYSGIIANVSGSNATTVYGYNAYISRQNGTIGTGYLFRGDYVGTIGTKWGIYLGGETKNYFSGDIDTGGDISLANNKSYYCDNTGGTPRHVAYVDTNSHMIFGDTATDQNYYRVADSHIFQTWNGGVATKLQINHASGISLFDNVAVEGNITPTSSGAYDLGSISMPWKDLYLTGDSIYMDGNKLFSATETGDVGIGTTTPSGKLHVSGGHVITDMGYGFGSYDAEGDLAGMYVFNGDDSLRLVTNATPRLIVSEDGNISITGTIKIGAAGTLEAGQDSPTGSGVLGYNGNFYATKVYNAVYNDIADFQKVLDEIEYGKCYYDTPDGAKLCTERCQMAVIGIASDTYGFGVGNHTDENYAPFAIAGWVLAHVDKEYPTGTPLTNNEEGILTEILPAEKREFPERIVATYKKKETKEFWGPADEIKVNGRSWVKVQ